MFNWFKFKKVNWFYGVNLNKWHYLGFTNISFTDSESENQQLASAAVFGFVHKNSVERCFSVVPTDPYYNFYNHAWVVETAHLWRIGERDIWEIANTEPSRWLVNYMKTQHNRQWVDSQWCEIKPHVYQEESSNVVTLDFKK